MLRLRLSGAQVVVWLDSAPGSMPQQTVAVVSAHGGGCLYQAGLDHMWLCSSPVVLRQGRGRLLTLNTQFHDAVRLVVGKLCVHPLPGPSSFSYWVGCASMRPLSYFTPASIWTSCGAAMQLLVQVVLLMHHTESWFQRPGWDTAGAAVHTSPLVLEYLQ